MITVLLAAALAGLFAALGAAKLAAVPAMRAAAAHLGLTVTQYRGIGLLELAGAGGVALGLTSPLLGIAAAVGLVCLMAGAALAHLRNHDPAGRIAAPVAVALLAAGYASTLLHI